MKKRTFESVKEHLTNRLVKQQLNHENSFN